MTAAMFQATIHGLRTVPTRKMVQIIIEAPIEHLSHIAKVAEHGAWVAVARLNPEGANKGGAEDQFAEDKPRSSLPQSQGAGGAKSYAQEAGRLCNDVRFQKFIGDQYGYNVKDEAGAKGVVYELCHVGSRREIIAGTFAGSQWEKIVAEYEAERVMA